MYIHYIKYKDDKDFKVAIEGIKSVGEIIRIHPPKKGDVWTKIKIDVEPKKL